MNSLVQRSFRTSGVQNQPVILDPGSGDAWRILRLHVRAISGAAGCMPTLRHVGSGGQVLAEFVATTPGGFPFGVSQALRIVAATCSGPTVVDPNATGVVSGSNVYAHIEIPADLVILGNETLQFELMGSGSYSSEIFWTAVLELPK